MEYYSKQISKLIEELGRLPGIGAKTAGRLAFHIINMPEESVEALKEELQTNVEKAEADLNAVYADQELSRQTAQYNYDSSIAYGSYASLEYDNTIKNLQDAVVKDAQCYLKSLES